MAENDIQEKALTPAQYRGVAALVSTGDVQAAADAGGVSERSVRRWMALPAFKQELVWAEAETLKSAARRMGCLANKALGVLEGVLDDNSAADGPRIRAATAVLDICLRWHERVTIEERLQALEKRMGGNRHGHR